MSFLQLKRNVQRDHDSDDSSSSSGSSGSSSYSDSDSSASSFDSSDDDSQHSNDNQNSNLAPPATPEGQATKTLDTVEAFYVEQEAKENDFEAVEEAAYEQTTKDANEQTSEQMNKQSSVQVTDETIEQTPVQVTHETIEQSSVQVTHETIEQTPVRVPELEAEQDLGMKDKYATFDEEERTEIEKPVTNEDSVAEAANGLYTTEEVFDDDAKTASGRSVHSSEKSIVVIKSNEEEVVIQVSNEDNDDEGIEGGFELEVLSPLHGETEATVEEPTNNESENHQEKDGEVENNLSAAQPFMRSETDEIIPKRISSTIMQDLSITVSGDDSSSDSSSDSSVSSDSSDSSSDYDIETKSIPSPTHTHHGYNTLDTIGSSPNKETSKLMVETASPRTLGSTLSSPKVNNGIEVSVSSHALTTSDPTVPAQYDSNTQNNGKEREMKNATEERSESKSPVEGHSDVFAEDDKLSSDDSSSDDDSVLSDYSDSASSSDSEDGGESDNTPDTKVFKEDTEERATGETQVTDDVHDTKMRGNEKPVEDSADSPATDDLVENILSKIKEEESMKEAKVESINDILAKLKQEQSKREEKVVEEIKAQDGFGEEIEQHLAEFQEKKEMTDYRSIFSFPVREKEKAKDDGISIRCEAKSERDDVVLNNIMSLRDRVVKPKVAWWVDDENASESAPDEKNESPQKSSEEWFLKQFQEAEAEDNALDIDELNRRLEQARLEDKEFSPRKIWWKVNKPKRKVVPPSPESRKWYFESINEPENNQGLANVGKAYVEKTHKKTRTWLTARDANDAEKLKEFMIDDDTNDKEVKKVDDSREKNAIKEQEASNANKKEAAVKGDGKEVNDDNDNINGTEKESKAEEKEKSAVGGEEGEKDSEAEGIDDESDKKDDDNSSNARLTVDNVIQEVQVVVLTKVKDGVYVQEETPEELVVFTEPLTFTGISQKSRTAKEILKRNTKKSRKMPYDLEQPSTQIFDLIEGAMGSSIPRRTNACGTIKLLASKKKNVSMLIKATGLLKALAFVIGEEPSDSELEARENARLRALSTLSMLSQPKEGRRIICEQDGLLESLANVLVVSKGEACLHACSIIAALAKTEENRDIIAGTNFLIRRLSVILKTTEAKNAKSDESESGSQSKASDDSEEGESRGDNSTEVISVSEKHLNAMRLNSCAAILHLSKQCSIVAKICKDHKIISNIAVVCLEKSSTLHTKCIEILSNLTRFPGNSAALSRNTQVSDAFHACGVSDISEDRLWTMRSLQNLTADPSSKQKLATTPILNMLCASAQKYSNAEEHEAAVAALANLCTDATAVVLVSNSKAVLPILVRIAYSDDCTPEVQFYACNAISRIAAWFQTFASATAFDEIKNKDALPTMVGKGYMRWDYVE